MKINKILFVGIFILGIVWLTLDRQLFYYGKNVLEFYEILPFRINPEFRYDFEGGFALEDQFGFYLVSKGERQYVGSDVKLSINEIVKYGFDSNILIVHVKDTSENNYYIQFEENWNTESKQYLVIKILNEYNKIFDKLKWINIQNEKGYIKLLKLIRNGILLVIIVLGLTIIYKILKFKRF